MIETWIGGEPHPYNAITDVSYRSHLGEYSFSHGVSIERPVSVFDGPVGRLVFIGDTAPKYVVNTQNETLEDIYWRAVKEHMSVHALCRGLAEFSSVQRSRAKEELREQIRDFFASTLGIGEGN